MLKQSLASLRRAFSMTGLLSSGYPEVAVRIWMPPRVRHDMRGSATPDPLSSEQRPTNSDLEFGICGLMFHAGVILRVSFSHFTF